MENEQYHSSLALRERKTVKKVAFILDHGADINQKDQDGNVILHDVLKHRYSIKTIQRLLNAGADVNARNHDGSTPLLVLLQQLNSVLHPGSDDPDYIPFPDSSEEKNIQHTECDAESFFTEAIPLLLNAGADVNICNNHDDTPLIIACRYGGSTIQKMLIAAGADVNYRDGNGVTPLMGILRNFPDGLGLFKDFEHKGFVSVLPKEQLLQYLKVRLDTAEEITANFLDYANTSEWSLRLLEAFYDLQSVAGVKVLLAAGADVNARDIYGRTPLMYAVRHNIYTYNITQLLEAGAYPDAKDVYGRTVLHFLAERQPQFRLKFLEALREAPVTTDQFGYTPWAYWCLQGTHLLFGYRTCNDILAADLQNFQPEHSPADPTFQMMLDRAEILLEQGGDLQLTRSEFVKTENEVPPQEDEHFRYFNFPSVFALILYKNFNPHAKELRLADRDYGRFYFLYSKLQGNDETLLTKAIAWNPYCAAYWFEYAELLKQQDNLQRLREVIGQMFEFLNDRQDIGTAYQYLGYYYEQQKMYELAACLYRFSMVYDGNDFAARDKLAELSCASGINFKYRHWDMAKVKQQLLKHHIPIGVDKAILDFACRLHEQAEAKGAEELIWYFKSICMEGEK
ncbi:ankyrin repeat domain-containing protein [uncultured Victivallis sp.]|uniref:ankyrin repeat domain-containing protein n=1 Tax=uncultured Victivallis sp. TaxID=354118 RepID=UPI002598E09C|nr:ankyrin repeat domain-containing protein [uncultured Victivallis sp.]